MSHTFKLQREQVELAVRALFALQRKQAQSSKNLFSDEFNISLLINFKKVPPYAKFPSKIPLAHSLYGSPSHSICFICKDPAEDYQAAIAGSELASTVTVIALSDLKKTHKLFEEKRKLCDSHDTFFADNSVVDHAVNLVGKYFIEKKKQPIPVRSGGAEGLPSRLIDHKNSTYLYLGRGACSNVKVGNETLTEEQVIENINTAVPVIVAAIPGQASNLLSISITLPDSVPLPIFTSAPAPPSLISLPSSSDEKHAEEEEPMVQEKPKVDKKKASVDEKKAVKGGDKQQGTPAKQQTSTPPKRSNQSAQSSAKKRKV